MQLVTALLGCQVGIPSVEVDRLVIHWKGLN